MILFTAHVRGFCQIFVDGRLQLFDDGRYISLHLLDANAGGPVYTDPDLAVKFCTETGIDALAPSFGTAHGIYKSKPVLDLERVKVIAEKTKLPLVMHGGSGVSDEDYRIAIRNGIRKINYYSYMSKAGVTAVKALLEAGDVTFFHDLALEAQKAMEENAYRAMEIFAGC